MKVRIPEDKHNRLLSAGLKEFSQQGYENANTNKICEEAQISKGLLFHYFESKLGFYKWIVEYVANYILEALDELIALETASLEMYTKKAINLALEIWNRKPEVIQFYQRARFDSNSIITDILTQPIYQKSLKIFKMHVTDYTDIRKDIETEVIVFVLYKLLEVTTETFFVHRRDTSGSQYDNVDTNNLLLKNRVNQVFDIFLNGALEKQLFDRKDTNKNG